MNALNYAISPDVSRAFESIGRIAQLRAEGRAKEIESLSGGRITVTTEQVDGIAAQLRDEMIVDITRDVRASLSFFVNTQQKPKG